MLKDFEAKRFIEDCLNGKYNDIEFVSFVINEFKKRHFERLITEQTYNELNKIHEIYKENSEINICRISAFAKQRIDVVLQCMVGKDLAQIIDGFDVEDSIVDFFGWLRLYIGYVLKRNDRDG